MIVLFCTRVTVVILLATKLSLARGSIHTWTHVVPVVPYFLYTHLQVQGRSFARYTPPQFFHRGRFMSQQPLLDVQKFSTNQPQTLIHANPKPQAGNHEPYTRSYSPKLQRQTMHPTTLLPGGTPSGDRVSCTQVGFSLAYRLAGALQSQGFRVLGLDFRCRVWN